MAAERKGKAGMKRSHDADTESDVSSEPTAKRVHSETDLRALVCTFPRSALQKLALDMLADPGGSTIAHGLITASLPSAMIAHEMELREQVSVAHRRLAEKKAINYRAITTDDFAEAVRAYLAKVSEIRAFACPGVDKLAFYFILHIGNMSLCDLDHKGCGYGGRGSFDQEADAALYNLAKARKGTVEDTAFLYELREVLKTMKRTSKYLAGYGINSWFPRSIALFEEWLGTEEVVALSQTEWSHFLNSR